MNEEKWTTTNRTPSRLETSTTAPPPPPPSPDQQAPSTGQRIAPTVSLDSRPIVIPMVSAMFGFPVIALAVICALRYRARRARLKSHVNRARTAGVIYRAGRGHRDFGKARLKVMRDPPTFTELSVIGSRGPSSSSDESSAIGHQYHFQRSVVAATSEATKNSFQGLLGTATAAILEPSNERNRQRNLENLAINGDVFRRMSECPCTSPLDILTGTAGLEFTYTVVVDDGC